MDDYLRQIAEAAEAGKEFPTMRVLAGNTLFVGQPGPSKNFDQDVARAIAEEIYNAQRPRKNQAEAVFNDAMGRGSEAAAPVRAATEGDGGPVLSLRKCQVWPASGGDGVVVPVVRIPLESVDGWWFGAGQLLKAPGGGGWLMGFGVVLPIDN